MSDTFFHIFGGPGSPYSHKLRAYFRYKRIPHTWRVPQGEFSGSGSIGSDSAAGVQTDMQKAAKSVVPVLKYPDGEYKSDTTPIMLELETTYPDRSILPPNKAIAFLAHLIEDMADEFLPIPMFYYRWTENQGWCSRRQMSGWLGALSDDELEVAAKNFLERQVDQLNRARSFDEAQMAHAYNRFLTVMEDQLRHGLFLFGTRPSLAEFGLYGQLTQYAVDPKVSAWLKRDAVRTYQWSHFIDDLSGCEGDWYEAEACLTPQLEALLGYVAEFYIPMAELLTEVHGLDNLESAVNGVAYRVKTFLDLKGELSDLDEKDRALIKPILERSGCWDGLQLKEGESEKRVAVLPV